MRKIICLVVLTGMLPGMLAFANDTPGTPPDSEMVYRTNLGRADDLDLLLKQGGNVHAVDNNGIGLLFLAAARKDSEGLNVLHKLIENGIDINSRDTSGRTALFYAARSGNPEMVQYLLDSGVDAYVTDRSGEMARNSAYRAGNTEIVTLMDNFARKKVEQVNSAYEQINRDLLERYRELEEQQTKTNKTLSKAQIAAAEAEQKRLDVERQAILDKRAAEWALAAEKIKLASAAKTPTANTQDNTVPAPTPVVSAPAAPLPAQTVTPSPAAIENPPPPQTNIDAKPVTSGIPNTVAQEPDQKTKQETKTAAQLEEEAKNNKAAQQIDESIRSTLLDVTRKRDMENKLIEEEQQDKKAQRELERKIQEEQESLLQSEEETKSQAEIDAAQKAADELEAKIYEANLQKYLKAEIDAEAAEIALQEQEALRKDPSKRKALLAEKQKKQAKRNEVFHDLAYNNCVFQYWYYCYTSGMTTQLKSDELRDAIENSKHNIADLQDTLINDYEINPKTIKDIGGSAKKRVFDQLDIMHSSRERRSRGVGNTEDMEKRCSDIALHWDVGAGIVVSERPKPVEDDKNATPQNSPQTSPIPSVPKKY